MKVMKRENWPGLIERAQRSVLILAPWIDDVLIEELFGFLPPIDVRIVFPRATLEEAGIGGSRYALRGVLDTNFDAKIRMTDEDIPACLVVDDEHFYYSERYADKLEGKASNSDGAIAYAREVWGRAEPWN